MQFQAENDMIRAAQTGNEAAKVALITKYAPAIGHATRQYQAAVDPDDAAQEATAALLEAIRDFNAEGDMEFRQFFAGRAQAAVGSIAAGIEAFTISPREYRRFLAMLKAVDGDVHAALLLANGGKHGMTRGKFLAIYSALRGTDSLDRLTDDTDELRSTPVSPMHRSTMTTASEVADVHYALSVLDDRSRTLCRFSYGFAEDRAMSDAEVASVMPMPTSRGKSWTQMSVNRARRAALDTMRTALSARVASHR